MPHSPLALTDKAAAQELTQALAALKAEFTLPEDFSPEVLTETTAAIAAYRLPEADQTQLPFLTIDPPSSTDLDQAMYLTRSRDGYTVYYAIADVPGFVSPGGALDAQTRQRGQTVYTPNGRVPLHPAILSENAASLLAGQIRGAFVWEIALDADGNATSTSVQRAKVRSVAKLGYEQAQKVIDDGGAPEAIAETLALLKEIGMKRIALEHERGGASLNVPQQEVDFVDGVYTLGLRPALPIEDWNAQISLLTGMAAAKIMLDGKVGILRNMPEPDEAAVQKFKQQARALGTPWPADMKYGDFLRTLVASEPKQLALMHAATSLFRGAGYTPFNGTVPDHITQAAVAAPYAHTTAPLRRLVDRFVLTICAALANGQAVPSWVTDAFEELPNIMRVSEQLANAVDRAAIDTVEAAVLSDSIGDTFDAVVVAGPRTNGNHNENHSANQTSATPTDAPKPKSAIQIRNPAVSAYCEGELEPGTQVKVQLVTADIATRTVLFRVAAAPAT